jgi:hypothetical protein
MKILSIAFFSILLTASIAMAGFTVKSGVYRMDQLDDAKAEALSSGKPVAFLYSDENTTCPLCAGASKNAMEALSDRCVIVYSEKADWAKMPKPVRTAIHAPEAGKYIPKIVVMRPNFKEVIVIVPYARGANIRDCFLKCWEDQE